MNPSEHFELVSIITVFERENENHHADNVESEGDEGVIREGVVKVTGGYTTVAEEHRSEEPVPSEEKRTERV